jgi:ferredoxin
MAFVICQPCIGTKDTACVDACPVDCIHPRKDEEPFDGETQLYIDPNECIDCGACVPECPVDAIFPEEEVPQQWHEYIEINKQWYEGR